MIQLDLNEEEREMLKDLMEEEISELRFEIADTERKDYRDMLKRKEALLKKVLEEVKK